jgi:hypothetical protein
LTLAAPSLYVTYTFRVFDPNSVPSPARTISITTLFSPDRSWQMALQFNTSRPMPPLVINSSMSSPYTLRISPGPLRPWTTTSPVHWVVGSTGGAGAGVNSDLANTFNLPSGRYGGCAWTGRDGELYEWGGYTGSAFNNYLRRFARASRQWILLRGGGTLAYGNRGQEASTFVPSPRYRHSCVVDDAGDMWMYGE